MVIAGSAEAEVGSHYHTKLSTMWTLKYVFVKDCTVQVHSESLISEGVDKFLSQIFRSLSVKINLYSRLKNAQSADLRCTGWVRWSEFLIFPKMVNEHVVPKFECRSFAGISDRDSHAWFDARYYAGFNSTNYVYPSPLLQPRILLDEIGRSLASARLVSAFAAFG